MKYFLAFIVAFSWLAVFGQVKKADTAQNLKEVIVSPHGFPLRNLQRPTGAESYIDAARLGDRPLNSFVDVLDAVPGVRMEERSPGSYRLSLRGSLLRSPFGIRNIKIYIDEFPLTDAGGNTYLNLIDAGSINSMTILKGPQSSIFGANTGGAVLVGMGQEQYSTSGVNFAAGSYGLIHQTAKVEQLFKNYNFSVNEGYQQSDGYRENSALKRKYLQTSHQWKYSERGKLKLLAFYSDLAYQTPGGLTEAQLAANPKAARPATPTIPGAVVQQAGIYNTTYFGGISNSYKFGQHVEFVTVVFGNHTDFKNPFITNYEKRKENTLGLRSFLNYRNQTNPELKYDLYLGVEGSRTNTKISNYANDKGTASTLQASDNLLANQDFAFLHINAEFNSKLIFELGASLNFFGYTYESYFPLAVSEQQAHFKAQLMPKLATSYLLNRNFTLRSAISKGYSPPTLAEVRASDNVINSSLKAEAGWNYEAGLHYRTINQRLTFDGSLFDFNLKNAIVRRLTTGDAEYFINAGGTKQLGSELQISWIALALDAKKFLNFLRLSSSFTYSHFRFEDYRNAAQDFSGNKLTGVPSKAVVSGIEFNFTKGIYLFAQHNYTSAIPLNDANSVYSRTSHVIDLKMGFRNWKLHKSRLDFSLGINNVFDQKYSLGNDLNAANNRYYNPAAGVNYYSSFGVRF